MGVGAKERQIIEFTSKVSKDVKLFYKIWCALLGKSGCRSCSLIFVAEIKYLNKSLSVYLAREVGVRPVGCHHGPTTPTINLIMVECQIRFPLILTCQIVTGPPIRNKKTLKARSIPLSFSDYVIVEYFKVQLEQGMPYARDHM